MVLLCLIFFVQLSCLFLLPINCSNIHGAENCLIFVAMNYES